MDIRDKEAWLNRHGVLFAVEFNEEDGEFCGTWMTLDARYTMRRECTSRDGVVNKTYDDVKDRLYLRCDLMERCR